MRLRKKKNTEKRMTACASLLLKEEDIDAWCDTDSLAIEIGSGKGGFITELAAQNPTTRYIAVEKERDCIVMAMEKANRAALQNLRFLPVDACRLCRLLPHGKFDILYLNFSDPWPKKKYAARRLTHRNMLRFFLPLLKEDGCLRFKTDNDKLFDFTVEEFKELGFDIQFITYDLHRESVANIMTEYETRFSELNVPIKSIWVKPNERVWAALEQYKEQKDRFLYHEVILDLHTCPADEGLLRLMRALVNMNLPFFVRTDRQDIAALGAPLAEAVLPAASPLPRTEPEDTAFISDDAEALAYARSLSYHTVAIGLDAPADEHKAALNVDTVTLR